MISDDLKEKTAIMLGSLSSEVDEGMYEVSEIITLSELGFSFPIPDGQKSVWAIKRNRRHICDMLIAQTASSVKHKQTNHEQKFDHLKSLIKEWDEEFAKAMEENYALFANVDISKAFGTYKGSGFVYDFIGNDVTNYGS